MNYFNKILATILILVFHFSNGLSQKQNGLIFGFGLGGGINIVNYEKHDYSYYDEEISTELLAKPGLSTNLKIGYAPTERFYVYWNSRTNWFKEPVTYEYSEDDVYASGVGGIGFTYFPFKNALNFYTTFQVGYSNFVNFSNPTRNNLDSAFSLGCGYEVFPRINTELNIGYGASDKSDYSGYLKNPLHINLTINYLFVAYFFN